MIGGSWLAAIVFFFFGGIVFRQLAGRRVGGVAWLILTYTLIRFVMGGDAFDFYQGLTLVCISTVALVAATCIRDIGLRSRRPGQRRSEGLGVSLD